MSYGVERGEERRGGLMCWWFMLWSWLRLMVAVVWQVVRKVIIGSEMNEMRRRHAVNSGAVV